MQHLRDHSLAADFRKVGLGELVLFHEKLEHVDRPGSCDGDMGGLVALDECSQHFQEISKAVGVL